MDKYEGGESCEKEIQVGYQAFVSDGGEEFGAVRQVSPERRARGSRLRRERGDFLISLDAVAAVHSQKVIFECGKLDPRLRRAIGHAHDDEKPGF